MMTKTTKPLLEQILQYRNEQVVHRFTRLYEISFQDAAEVFTETKKWLWLCHQAEVPMLLTEPLTIIDEMWHNFILFSADYAAFCDRYFGRFLHHAPLTHADKQAMSAANAQAPEAFADERAMRIAEQCVYIHYQLGESTLLTWYVKYPLRYNTEFFRTRFKSPQVSWQPTSMLRGLLESTSVRGVA